MTKKGNNGDGNSNSSSTNTIIPTAAISLKEEEEEERKTSKVSSFSSQFVSRFSLTSPFAPTHSMAQSQKNKSNSPMLLSEELRGNN